MYLMNIKILKEKYFNLKSLEFDESNLKNQQRFKLV